MLTLETFGITPGYVTKMLFAYSISFITTCAALIAIWCLFVIGLAAIAKHRGEEKYSYAYLPLFRLYTLGKMAPVCEKSKKVFACLLPSVAIARFVMAIISAVLFVRALFAIIFAAESMPGSSLTVEGLINFPVGVVLWALIITFVLAVAYKAIYAFCVYGAISNLGKSKAIIFALITFFVNPNLGGIFLFVAAKNLENKAEAKPETADEQ